MPIVTGPGYVPYGTAGVQPALGVFPVDASGNALSPLTDAQLRAAGVPVLVAARSSTNLIAGLGWSASGGSSLLTNPGARGAMFTFRVASMAGSAPSLTFKMQVQEPFSGTWLDVPGVATAALTADGASGLMVYPGIAEVAGSRINAGVPAAFRWYVTLSGDTTATLSSSAHWIL